MKTTNERSQFARAVVIATVRDIVRRAFRRLDGAEHALRGSRVMVRTIVRPVLHARDGADGDPEQVHGGVRQCVHVGAVFTDDIFNRLKLLSPRRRISVALDDASRDFGEIIRVPPHVSLVVPTLVRL